MLCRQARQAQLPADKDMTAAGVDKPEGMQPAAAASAAAVNAAEKGKGAVDPEAPQSVSQAAGSDVARVKGVFPATLAPPPLSHEATQPSMSAGSPNRWLSISMQWA